MEQNRPQDNERTIEKRTSFIPTHGLLLITIVAASVGVVLYLPSLIYVLILLAFLGVPVIPFVTLFATIALGPERGGRLTVNNGPFKALVTAWLICVMVSALVWILVYWGLVY